MYKRTNDSQFQGGHAIKIVGWGVEKKLKYWTVANSWGVKWGEEGYFRLIRGQGPRARQIESPKFLGSVRRVGKLVKEETL